MSGIEISWTVVGIIVPASVGLGYAAVALTPPDLKFCRICFWFSAVVLGGMDIVWYSETDRSFIWRAIISGLIGTAIFVLLPEGLRFVYRRELLRLVSPAPQNPEAPKPPPETRAPETRVSAVPPVRRPIEIQAAMLRGWIDQTTALTKVNEMWLSQIFQYQLDNIPAGPEVDAPAALRYLNSKGEVKILETAPRPYRTWWGEDFQEDIQFKIQSSASTEPPLKPSAKLAGNEKQARAATPQPTKPEIYAYFVKGTSPGIVLGNQSEVVVRDPAYTVNAWNLDSRINLPAYNKTENGMFIKKGKGILEATLDNPSMKPQIQNGDHILALIGVDCPECERTKYYWLFVTYGGDSWYSSIPEGATINILQLQRSIQEAEWDVERFIASVPHGERLKPMDYPTQ
jgi:hypothetical protein